ncbi:MAG: sensor histidine kinase [Sphingobacteriales bacterium]|uniref:sensor histidine kinase n=1 Tax=Hydrotalea flava TaxID=714549 RepID=UPI00083240CC|nr:histidine kinase [Hydrotalea flava]RTL47774.1 MAG: sensor histidine kinase [Sphingobacteriales bacterium]
MRNKISTYWWCQILGWSAYTLVWTFFYFAIRSKPQPFFFQSLFTDAFLGLVITHLMRMVIKGFDLIRFDLQKQIFLLLITALVFALLDSLVFVSLIGLFNWELPQLKQYSFGNRVARALLTTFLFYLIWNFIYFTYHYIQKSRRDELDKIRLQSLVKELELKTIKSHINPHFIFNALNSIRALVDENPQRARTAITELSNILRSSMQSEKLELAPFERELNIVKDYLALEHIRFEERLQVEYDIDEDTLEQPIPPMMLQTLVENAIKHGISQQRDGGIIKIISNFKENHHELIVQNSGTLNSQNNTEGFGITSTLTRLNLLYGKEAKFELNTISDEMVEAKVILPVQVK